MQTRRCSFAAREMILIPALVGALTVLLLAPLPALAQNPTHTKWALLVGVSTYESKDIAPLTYPASDVQAVKGALIRYRGFSRENIFVMTSASPKGGSDYPTNRHITNRLTALKRVIKEGDTFVFYFSGHAFEDEQSYLGTVDAQITNHASLARSTLSVAALQNALSGLPVSQFLLVFDANRRSPYADRSKDRTNGVRTPGQTRDLVRATRAAGRGTARSAIFFSCEEGTRSYEDAGLKQGVFPHFFMDGLANAPRETTKGLLAAKSLGKYLTEALGRWRGAHPQEPQVPEYRELRPFLMLATNTARFLSPNTFGYHSTAAYKAAIAAYDAYEKAPEGSAAQAQAARRAAPLLRPFARAGDSGAQGYLGRILLDTPATQTEAILLYRKAAEQGNTFAQNNLANCYFSGRVVAQDYAQAVEWYGKAAHDGNTDAQYNLGLCYENGYGVARDYVQAAEYYRQSAEWGNDADAQVALGLCYYDGRGVSQDYEAAVEWYRKSADQGNPWAQSNLADCCENGKGVAKDLQKAFLLYRKAAKQGNSWAQYRLGYYYENGQIVARDITEAVAWYRKSAAQGEAAAQNRLAHYYESGLVVPQDYAQAAELYRKAADQGNVEAWFNLGRCYENGLGIAKDLDQAVQLYRKAANRGDADAREALKRLGQ